MNRVPPAAPEGTAAPRPPRRALRRGLIVVGLLLLVLLVAALSSPWWFTARRVADLAVALAGSATGLEWSYDGEPALRWRPQPWLSLPGLRVRDAQERTLLAAEALEIAVPWSTLRGESLRVDALRLVAPDIDVDAALAWWNTQPAGDTDALPQLDELSISRGRLRWTGGSATDIALTMPRFAVGEPMALDVSGRVTLAAADGDDDVEPPGPPAAPTPFDLAIRLRAMPQADPLRFESLALDLTGSGPVPTVAATGQLRFDPWTLDATGTIASWPERWPTLPSPLSSSTTPIAFTMTQRGESALAAELSMSLSRDEVRVDARGVPDQVLAWLDDADAAALPPLDGRTTLPAVDVDGVRLEGVSIDLGDAASEGER
ncbi:MAG: hypothetical protein ACRC2H_10980 [Silanimonas sp.]